MYFQKQDIQPRRQLASLSGALWTHVLHALCLHGGAFSFLLYHFRTSKRWLHSTARSVCKTWVCYNTLFQTGHVKCNTIKCPALPCENPVAEPQQCCPRCTGRSSSSKQLVSSEAFRKITVLLVLSVLWGVSTSDDQPRIPAGLRASVKSCRYNGTIYQPGETFNKHDLFPSKQSNQCVMCTCSVSYLSFPFFVLRQFILLLIW